jgi:hypothetical protein
MFSCAYTPESGGLQCNCRRDDNGRRAARRLRSRTFRWVPCKSRRIPRITLLGKLQSKLSTHPLLMMCERRLRMWLHRETYYSNATRDDELFMQVHLGHCIEVLRLSVMCTADLGIYSFFWSSLDASKPTARSSAPRKCKEWSQIDDWSRKRMLSNTHITLLKED